VNKREIKLHDIVKSFNLQVECGEEFLDREILGGYVSDLLSDVMAYAKKGDIWVTRQVHPNIIAVAVIRMLPAIILINNFKPEEETVKKAITKKLPILTSNLPAFELVGKLYEFGIHGLHE
jgi:serine kinase of HPr protein (carbohydrate metabolism regulator)